jgi:hypothetical protein
MAKPRVYADFHNADPQGRLRLNCAGTLEDLVRQQIQLYDGLQLTLYSDDANEEGQLDELLADGIVCYSVAEHCWVAAIDWDAVRHASDVQPPTAAGPGQVPPVPSTEGRISKS